MVQAAVLAAVFGLDTAVKNFINNHKLQGSETRILKEKVFIRNLHNPDGIFGIMKGHKEASRKLSLLILGGVLWEFFRNFFKKGSSGGWLWCLEEDCAITGSGRPKDM